MKNFRYKYLLLAPLFLTACADWDDHFEADTAILDSQKATLWQNISGKSNLSQFASLLQKVGYQENLSSAHTYTVWAPVDGSYDYDALTAVGNDRLLKQFVQNHVARNNYPATGVLDAKIYMLNEKMMKFAGSGSDYTIQGIALDGANENIGSSNGTLHLINNKIPFLPNIYESLNSEDYDLDSISKYFHQYDVKKLDESSSVAGPIVDGEQTYLDSIFYETNPLYSTYRAYINHEDSNYTMLVPTDEAWHKARTQIEQYYNYIPEYCYMRTGSSGNDTTIIVTLKDAEQLEDSLKSYMLFSDLFMNNNIGGNTVLKELKEGATPDCDSLFSTRYNVMYGDDAKNLFTDAKRVDKSNGAIWVTDSLRFRPWLSWNPEITAEAEHYAYKTQNATEIKQISYSISGLISNNTFIEVKPSTPKAHPEVFIQLPNVRSTTYEVYVVMVPITLGNTSAEYLPNSFSAYVQYCKENGRLSGEVTMKANSKTVFTTSDYPRIDTISLGTVTFPVSYYGVEGTPYLHLRSRFQSKYEGMYERTLRVDCVILRPVELDAYIKENPGYVYDKHKNY